MLFGQSLIYWVIVVVAFLLLLFFLLWGIPLLLALLGVALPHIIVVLLSLLIALVFVFGAGPRIYAGTRSA